MAKVKKLEWSGPSKRHQYKSFDGVVYSASFESIRLDYHIDHYMTRERPQFLLRGPGLWFAYLEDAKAAAQADAETRINAVLEKE